MIKRFWRSGCWGPSLIVSGVLLVIVSFAGAAISMLLNHRGPLDNGVYGPKDVGIWSSVTVLGVWLVCAGASVALMQGLLWLVGKALGRR